MLAVRSHMRSIRDPRCSSIETNGAPRFIMLELEDNPPNNLQYNLRPLDERQLTVGDTFQEIGTYKLVALLMHKKGAHYITHFCDPRDGTWMCHDGMDGKGGVAHAIPPTTGRVRHSVGACTGQYYPVLVVYARTGRAVQDWSGAASALSWV